MGKKSKIKSTKELKEHLDHNDEEAIRAAWTEDRPIAIMAKELNVSSEKVIDYLLEYCEENMRKQVKHHLNVFKSEIQSNMDKYEQSLIKKNTNKSVKA